MSPTDLVVVARAGFGSGALSVADACGVDLVESATLARLEGSAADAGLEEE